MCNQNCNQGRNCCCRGIDNKECIDCSKGMIVVELLVLAVVGIVIGCIAVTWF